MGAGIAIVYRVRENGRDPGLAELGIPETKRFVSFQKGGHLLDFGPDFFGFTP